MPSTSGDSTAPVRPPPHGALLLVLFVGSGAAALVYEIVWFQMLELVIGATSVSLGVLLGTFMGGMFVGSLALPRFVERGTSPLKVYALLETGIGVLAIALLGLIPLVSGAYVRIAPPGLSSVPFRALLAALLLVPPTVLMGATLPAVSRYVETTREGVAWMGFFYGGNLAGAVLGCLGAGFYLLREHDIVFATLVAAAVNATVASVAYGLSRAAGRGEAVSAAGGGGAGPAQRGPHASASDAGPSGEGSTAAGTTAQLARGPLIAIALSGLTALGAEVVWTRLMSLMLGATTYTFSIILAVFLAALGVGSAVGSHLSRTARDTRLAFAICQLGSAVGIAWTAHAVAMQLPYWPIDPSIAMDPWYVFELDLARALWALAPAPFFWGASFPLAVAALAGRGQDPARLVGRVYAWNTAGAIVGSLAFGIFVLAGLGSRDAQRVLIAVAVASLLVLLAPAAAAAIRSADRTRARAIGWSVAAIVGAVFLLRSVQPIPPVLVEYGRYSATYDTPNTLYVGEGRNSSIAVTELDNGVRNMHVGGKVVASTEPQDMHIQGMIGHLAGLLREEPRTVLVVGFGAGVTAGTLVTYPTVERIVICEIEPLITGVTSSYFTEVNNDVLSDPRVEVVLDDARHFLLTTDETFDIITSDPIHPWMKGAAALYSEEYFEVVRDHLNPGGVVTQWVPLYESNTDAVKSEMATFFRVFPDGTVWSNLHEGGGYDVVVAARQGGLTIDLDDFVGRLLSSDYSWTAMSLGQTGFRRVLDILATYAGNADDLSGWLADAEVNTDRNLRLMYLAGLGLNRYREREINDQIVSYRTYPEGMFTGDPGRVEAFRNLVGFER